MKILLPISVSAILLLSGCGQDKPAPTEAQAKTNEVKPEPAPSNEVQLTSDAQKEARLEFVDVEARSVGEVLRTSGRLVADENRTYRVGAVTDGRIIRVEANVGDRVDKGQTIARMHSHDIHESRALYRKSVGDQARLEAALSFAQRTRDRAKRLYELKAASLEQVEHAENELSAAQTALANAKIEVQRTRQHLVEFLQINPDEPADHEVGEHEHDDDLIPIKSPASGTVLTRNVTAGTVVAPTTDIFTISDLKSIWMIANVNEENLSQLRTGMNATVQVQAYPNRSFTGKITKLGDELDPTTRTIKARIELSNAGGLLKPEMYATAEIAVGSGGTTNALMIPDEAVQEVNGNAVVFVQKDKQTFLMKPVQRGRTHEHKVEILNGLNGGEKVVVNGSFVLKSQVLKATMGE